MSAEEADWRARIEHRLATVEAALAARAPPVIHVRCMGNLANRMIQYMAALALQARIPGARLSNVDLLEWGITHARLEQREPCVHVPNNRIDLDRVAGLINAGIMRDALLLQYLQHVDNLLPPAYYRGIFGRRPPLAYRFDRDVIVISLRMDEVLSGVFPLYTLLPVRFYQDVVRHTGLQPVFFGQLTPSPYLDALRAAFPDAPFIAGREPMEDFEVLRSAPNLCLSVSTFSWTAAFLSDAARIVIPVSGLLSPGASLCQGADHDLVPRRDPRYEHWLFPVNFAVPNDRILEHHDNLDGRWRRVSADEARRCLDRCLENPRRIEEYRALFDADYYLATHREVADAVGDGRLGSAAHHYTWHGFDENRTCFPLDIPAYARAYPDAANAVGVGRYRDLHHFHAAVGAVAGYLPAPVPDAGLRAA
jgi:hypothetical protein